MKTHAQILLSDLISKAIHPVLKGQGFKKQALNFYRDLGVVGHHFNIQKSQWGSKEEIRFTCNIGIFIPAVFSATYGKSPQGIPAQADCTLRWRIGHFLDSSDVWFELGPSSTSIAPTSEIIVRCITDKILPLLDGIRDLPSVISIARKQIGQRPDLVHLLCLNGQNPEAAVLLQKMVNGAGNAVYRSTLLQIGERYSLSIVDNRRRNGA